MPHKGQVAESGGSRSKIEKQQLLFNKWTQNFEDFDFFTLENYQKYSFQPTSATLRYLPLIGHILFDILH